MKKMKKLLAMMLAVVMVVGVVNLPTKAAGESEATAIATEFNLYSEGGGTNASNLLCLTFAGQSLPGNEVAFVKGTTASLKYNGVETTSNFNYVPAFGSMYIGIEQASNGNGTANAGDILSISGIWALNGVYYNFEESDFYFDGSNWKKLVDTEFRLYSEGGGTNASNLLCLTFDGQNLPGNEVAFVKGTTASLKYNGVETTSNFNYVPAFGSMYIGIEQANNGNGTANAGDILSISGIWALNGVYYNFEESHFYFDGSNWKKLVDTEFRLYSEGGGTNASNLLCLTFDGQNLPTGEVGFTKGTTASLKYNGVETTSNFNYVPTFGSMYIGIEQANNGNGTANAGDILSISGIWALNGVYYNFKESHFYFDGSNWKKLIDTEFRLYSEGGGTNASNLLCLTFDGQNLPGNEVAFAKGTTASLKYNGVETTSNFNYVPAFGSMYIGIEQANNGNGTAQSGDTLSISGIWALNGVYYNFEDANFKFNGTSWEAYEPIVSTDVTFGIDPRSSAGLLLLTVSGLSVTENASFTPASEDAKLTYVETERTSFSTIAGGMYLNIDGFSGQGNAATGAIVRLSGVWKYSADNKYYNFGDVSFKWNGSNWAEYVPVASTDVTFEIAGHANNENVLLLVPTGMTVAEGEPVFTAVEDAVATYNGVALKKLRTAAGGIYLDVSGISDNAKAARKDVIRLSGIWNYTGDNQNYNFGDVSYVFNGVSWSEGTTLSDDFSITGIGECEKVDGWKLRFTTDNILAGTDFETELGTVKVNIAGKSTDVKAYVATGYGLGLYIEDGLISQGTVIEIPAGAIGEYQLTEAYSVIFDAGTWKKYTKPTDLTLSFGRDNGNVVIYTATDEAGVTAYEKTYMPAYANSGVYLNGQKLDGVGLFCNHADGTSRQFWISADETGWNEVEDNIITVRGIFYNGETYVNFSEMSTRFNGETWEPSVNYDHFIKTGINRVQGEWRPSFTNWIFRIETSTPLEAMEGDFAGDPNMYHGKLTYTVTTPDGQATEYTENTLFHAQIDGKSGCLGIVVSADHLPAVNDASGYKITINSASFTSANYVYKLTESYTYVLTGSSWVKETNRPLTSSTVVGDADGNGSLGAEDLVRIIKELQKVDGALSTENGLIDGKTKATEFDEIRIREMLLQGVVEFDDNGVALGYPVYLQDEYIRLAAYMGPRSEGRDLRYDENGNLLSGYTKKSFLTAEEFKRYADSGLNTLIAEGDASFSSIGDNGMGSGGGHWSGIAQYMNLAKDANLDVYLSSNALDAYLKGNATIESTDQSKDITLNEAFIERELNEMFNGIEGYGGADGLNGYQYTGVLAWDNFKGVQLADELVWANRNYFVSANNIISKLAPDAEVLVSMLSGISDESVSYKEYHQFFGQNNLSNEFTYNQYPYQADAKRGSFNWSTWKYDYDYSPSLVTDSETSFFTNLQNSAIYAKEGGYNTGISLQSYGMENHVTKRVFATPTTVPQIGFQVYSALAYGVKTIDFFTYWEHYSQSASGEVHTGSMVSVDANGNVTETATYRAVQTINKQILEFDHVFLDYDWQTTLVHNADNGSNHLNGLDTSTTYPRIAEFTGTTDTMIGCMKDPDKGYEGFWLVNGNDPMMIGTNTNDWITVKFNNADQILIYSPASGIYGELRDLPETGIYETNLSLGQAEFVIPIKTK